MQQDRIYRVELPDGQKTFHFIVNATEIGIIIHVFDNEPSRYTEPEHAVAAVALEVEPTPDAVRVMLRFWDDETAKDGDALHVITLAEQEKEDE